MPGRPCHASAACHLLCKWAMTALLLPCRCDPLPLPPVSRLFVPHRYHPAVRAGGPGLRGAVPPVSLAAAVDMEQCLSFGWSADAPAGRRGCGLGAPPLAAAAHPGLVLVASSIATMCACILKSNLTGPLVRPCRFVPDADAWRETWDGARLSTDAALEVFGADEALPLSQVSLVLGRQACNDHTCVV